MKKIVSLVLALLVSACVGTSRPAKFYSLQGISSQDGAAVSNVQMTIGIEEVKIPDYLDKPQIVTVKDNSVELGFSEMNRWSEALSAMMQRTIAADMSVYLPRSVVKARNLSRETFDYVVFVEVDKFDGAFDNQVHLRAWWYALNRDGKIVVRERGEFSQPAGDSYDELVRAESRLTAELARQIAQKVAKLPH